MDKGKLVKIIIAAVILVAAGVMILRYLMASGGDDTGGRGSTDLGAIEMPIPDIA